MIGNITNGGSPGEAARYIAGPARDEHGRDVPGTEGRATLIGSRGFGFEVKTKEDVELAIRIMEQDARNQASLTKPVQNTVIHMTNSWHPGYTPSREEMIQARDHFARAMGMENARSISWSHNDTPQAHTHTMFGGINQDTGYAFPSARRNEHIRDAAIEWERARGQVTPARQPQHDEYDRRRAGVEQERDAVQQAAERDDYVRENGRAAIGLFKAHGQETWPGKVRETVLTKGEQTMGKIRDALDDWGWWKKPHQERERWPGELAPQQERDVAARRSAVDGLYKDHRAEWHMMQDQAAYHYGDPPRTRVREIFDDVMRRPTAQQIRDNRREAERAIEKQQASQRAIEAPREQGQPWDYENMKDYYKDIENQRRDYGKAEDKLQLDLPGDKPETRKAIEENWKRDLEKINQEIGKSKAEREEQGRELPRSDRQESHVDGATGKGRPDRTEATRQISFHDQVAKVTRNVKPQEQPIGRDRGLDR